MRERIGDWIDQHRAKAIVVGVVFGAGVIVGLMVAQRLGRSEIKV